ncbi:CvpA family protein [Patescibacteria group bacterium]|nr:MAG: CvpA family protein [Patescibacteria group bacterium]
MSLFDIFLLIIIAGFGLYGMWFGLVRAVGRLISLVVGLYLAGKYYEPMANWLMNFTGWKPNFSKVLVFIIAFIIISRLVGLVFWFLEKVFSIFTRLPVIKSLDRLLGLVFGLLEGAIILGVIFYFIARFPVSKWLMDQLVASAVAPYTVKIASFLWPLLPEALRVLQSAVKGIL